MSLCPVCFTFFSDNPVADRPAVYCKSACKQKAYRLRKNALNPDAPKKPRKARVKPLVMPEKHLGVSGTVHLFPSVAQQQAVVRTSSPVIRSVADLKAFFNGAL